MGTYGILWLLYPIRFFKKHPKQPVDFVKALLFFTAPVTAVIAGLDLANAQYFQLGTGISFFVWLGMEGFQYFDTPKRDQIIPKQIFGIPGIAIFFGAVFKVMQWPYATVLLICGIGLAIFIYLKEILQGK